ncbi:protein kinase domain-containing protein [Limnospira platensis CENA597]|uniref:protein kinase domain-containing protein n=1 Tax=Limnospira platensis TaxID=118562 RepID=UPI003D9FEF08
MADHSLLNHRYQIIQPLGSGGFGETFLAEDTQMPSGRRCVIKQLKPVTDNPDIYQLVQDRFQREAAILEELGTAHQQIPTLYAYFRENDLFYLVQEWIEGQTLTDYVHRHGSMRESSVRAMLVSLLSVLEYVHSKQIVHRDIKPDNIMLRSSNLEPVLLDFGAVKETMGTVLSHSGNPTRSVVVGTPGFMASEQAIGRPIYSSDLYALGLTAIFCLTGKVPQEFSTDPLSGNLLWRSEVPTITPSFANAIEQAIQSHPDKRFSTAGEMRAALNFTSHTGTSVSRTGQPTATIISSNPNQQPPTIVSSVPVGQAATILSPAQSMSPTALQNPSTMPEWAKAVLTGGIIGSCIIVGLFVSRFWNSVADNAIDNPIAVEVQPTTTASASQTPSQSESEAESQPPKPAVQAIPSITEEKAVALVKQWLQSKSQIFAPPYSRDAARNLTTGALLTDLVKADGPITWLQNNNAYYQYGIQRVDSVERFESDQNNATIELIVTEDGTLYRNGKPDPNNAYFSTSRYRYTIKKENNQLKISWYQKVD